MHKLIQAVIIVFVIMFAGESCISGAAIIIVGDSRRDGLNADYLLTRLIVENAVRFTLSEYGDISAIIMTGDYVESGEDDIAWKDWKEANREAFNYPVYPCIGNHDDEKTECSGLYFSGEAGELICYFMRYYLTNYYKTFQLPEWYSVDIDNIHIVSLSSNYEGYDAESRQGDIQEPIQWSWLRGDLAENNKKWTIAVWHEPAYGSHTYFGKGHGSNRFIRKRYLPLLERYGCDLVLCGHNHWYERTVPILDGSQDDNGIVHVTTGGGGAPLLPVSRLPFDKVHGANDNILSEVNVAQHHFCVLTAEKNVLRLQAVKYNTFEILDEIEISNR